MTAWDTTVEMYYDAGSGAGWQDITDWMAEKPPLSYTVGRTSRTAGLTPAEARFTLRTGVWVPVDPRTALYGKAGMNTPVRVKVEGQTVFAGEVSSWRPRMDKTGKDELTTVEVEASGLSRRLGHGVDPLESAMYRQMTSDVKVRDYWPCEMRREGTIVDSPVGGRAAVIQGGWRGGEPSGITGSSDLIRLSSGVVVAKVRPYTTGSGDHLAVALVRVPDAGTTDGGMLLDLALEGGDLGYVNVKYGTGGTLQLLTFDHDRAGIDSTTPGAYALDGRTNFVRVRMLQVGADLDVEVHVMYPDDQFGYGAASIGQTLTLTGVTMGRVGRIAVGTGGTLPGCGVGHLALLTNAAEGSFLSTGFTAHYSEGAVDRIERLCTEQDVPLETPGDTPDWVPTYTAGQRPTGLLDLLEEAADADGGMLFDHDEAGVAVLRYRPRSTLLSQSPFYTLDYAAGHLTDPLTPVVDDDELANDITLSSPEGGSVRVQMTEGPMSVQPVPDGVGRYDTSSEVAVARDSQLPDQARWRLYLGTHRGLKWAEVTLDLDADPSLASALDAHWPGDVIEVLNLPYGTPSPALFRVEGWTETVGTHRRLVTLYLSPGEPWSLPRRDDTGARRGGYGSTVDSGGFVAGTSTSLVVASPSVLWTTDAGDYPQNLDVGGAILTATACTGTSSPQTFTVNATAVNGVTRALPVGTPVNVARPLHRAL
jgi:hypothetical protein